MFERQGRGSQSNSETSEHGKEAGFDPGKDGKALRGTKHKPTPPLYCCLREHKNKHLPEYR